METAEWHQRPERILAGPRGWLSKALLILLALPHPAFTGSLPLDDLLERVGHRVELFWRQFSSIACTETVEQVKLSPKGKALFRERTVYDYLILMQLIGNDLTVEESRIQQGKQSKKGKEVNRTLLVTHGFSTLLLIFHPHFQSSYEFTRMADERLGERRVLRIDFEQVPGSRSPSVLQAGDRDYPLQWKGSAWIDPDSGSVVKMRTGLRFPMLEVGLASLNSEVRYVAVNYEDSQETYWLPETALIEARTRSQRWRNLHHFSNYKRFSVETEVKVANPE